MAQTISQRDELGRYAKRVEYFAPPNDTPTLTDRVVVGRSLDFASEISAQTNERAEFSTFYSDPDAKPQSAILRTWRWFAVMQPDDAVAIILCVVVGALVGMLLWWMRG